MKINEVTNTNEAMGPTAGGASLGAIIGAALGGAPGALALGVIGGLLGLVVGSADKKQVARAIKEPEKDFFRSDIYYRLEADVFTDLVKAGSFKWETGDRDGNGNVEQHLRWRGIGMRPKISQAVEDILGYNMTKLLDFVNSFTDDTEKVNQILNKIATHMANRFEGATAQIEDYDNLGSWYDLDMGLLDNDNSYLRSTNFRKVVASSNTFADRAINQNNYNQQYRNKDVDNIDKQRWDIND